ncbi:MAG TPA: transporter substrate-binding domain-containing protein [Stellaceae bacterium]
MIALAARNRWALRILGAAAAIFCQIDAAPARSLEVIRANGALHLCAHPNSLPYASKAGKPAGFQIELGEALAEELGVSLTTEWVVVPSQVFRTDCDIVLDAIADPEAQAETGLRISKPYYRSGVGLAVPRGSAITNFASLGDHTKVGVQVGSVAAMQLNQQHVRTSTFGFEEDMLEALAAGEIDAAAVTPLSAGYYNLTHPALGFVILPPDETRHDLVWNAAVGIRRPDDQFVAAIDAALDRLRADGTVATIYAKYGISLLPPR